MAPPRVLIIITGGTICMLPGSEEGTSFQGLACAPLEAYLKAQPELSDPALPQFDVHEWDQLIDSSDVTGQVWNRLVKQISEEYNKYVGFVVLHGTDSLAYSASALSFMLEHLDKPVVLTGSMLPMSHVHTDARKNVTVSLLVAGFSAVPEVLVVFGSRILRGCRTTKANCLSMDAFESPNVAPLGTVGIDIAISAQKLLPRTKTPLTTFTSMLPNSVFCLSVTPAFPPFLIRHIAAHDERPLGIVLRLFGTGTAPTGNPRFLEAIEFAIKAGVVIVAVTQCFKGTCSLKTYLNGQRLHELGVIEGKDMTSEAAFAKLAYLFGKGYTGKKLRELMEMDLRGELAEHRTKITGQAALKPPMSITEEILTTEDGLENPRRTLSPVDMRRHPYEENTLIMGRRASLPNLVAHAELSEGVTLVGFSSK